MEILDDKSPAVKYVVIPGCVYSKTDGQEHYVGALALMNLYGVPAHECTVYDYIFAMERPGYERAHRWKLDKLIRLAPRYHGNYDLPTRR